jgi:hypothetical protein
MARPRSFCALVLILSALVAASARGDKKVVITVERPRSEQDASTRPPFAGQRPAVDVAILLDTSNSMDGLISQAKSQLWTIVQQFAKAQKNGQTPFLRVALFEYGNTRLPASEGYIRQVVPLAGDLDKLSEALFALSTSGGDEYCGQVIDEAIKRLDWSKEPGAYKAIFICGNEPFTQGPVDYHAACKQAIERGIVVNTIHCGHSSAGVDGKWRDGAQLAEGEFFNIDQDRAIVYVKCPQDEVIIKLNADLNKTYLWYGTSERRDYYCANQQAQDSNALAAGEGVAARRASIKAGALYDSSGRDLVDTIKDDAKILEKLKQEELPEVLQSMAPGQRVGYVNDMAARRSELQRRIVALSAEREAYLADRASRPAEQPTSGATLGDAIVTTLKDQLEKSGFQTVDKP